MNKYFGMVAYCVIDGSIDHYDPKFELTDLFFATQDCEDNTVVKEGSCICVGRRFDDGAKFTDVDKNTLKFTALIPSMGVAVKDADIFIEMTFEELFNILCGNKMKLVNGSGYWSSEDGVEVTVNDVSFYDEEVSLGVELGFPYFEDEENGCTTIMLEG